MTPNRQSRDEESVNVMIHGLGFVLSVPGFFLLLALSLFFGDAPLIAGSFIFGATLSMVFLASVLYHNTRNPTIKRFFRYLDHICIYLLIAGTVTFIALNAMEGLTTWFVVGLEWLIAIGGIVMKVYCGICRDRLSVLLYILAAGVVFIGVPDMLANFSSWPLGFMIGGCTLYLLGVPFYLLDQKYEYFHSVWHAFVLGGATCHYFMVLSTI